jgi:hypothetical protein
MSLLVDSNRAQTNEKLQKNALVDQQRKPVDKIVPSPKNIGSWHFEGKLAAARPSTAGLAMRTGDESERGFSQSRV